MRPVAGTARYAGSEIRFFFDSSRLSGAAETELNRALDFLRDHPYSVILLEGHADPSGASSYNLDLSDRRARSAKAWLLSRGIAAARIVTVSYGEESGEGRLVWEKRRVVISDGAL
jgi:peptidoglycan-associated lipoprotein